MLTFLLLYSEIIWDARLKISLAYNITPEYKNKKFILLYVFTLRFQKYQGYLGSVMQRSWLQVLHIKQL